VSQGVLPGPEQAARPPVTGLALGGGSARGWAHIGVLKALRDRGIEPDIVAGTSIGALVGAAYVVDYLDDLEAWTRQLRWQDVVSYLDIRLDGGLIAGDRLFDFLRLGITERAVEDCPRAFAAVATDLASGHEVWLRSGPILEAVRASSALPGLFIPVRRGHRWLVDGGLVNPVPVSVCRALGADLVIAVDLNADLLSRHPLTLEDPDPTGEAGAAGGWSERLGELMARLLPGKAASGEELPSILEVMARSLNIMSVRITRSRMAGDPPDVLLTPRLARIGLMEFHRAAEAIDEGAEEVERSDDLAEWLGAPRG